MKRTAFPPAIFLFLAFSLSMYCPSSASAAACLEYGPAVQLTGNLIKQTFPGPPNFASVAQGDAPEVGWILHLDKPVCVKAGTGNNFDVAVSHLTDLQLVLVNDDFYRQAQKFLTRKVIVTGILFGAHTGHHHTPVLLDVKNMQLMVNKY